MAERQMPDLPPNSNNYKEKVANNTLKGDNKKVEKVVTSEVKRKKQTIFDKINNSLMEEDGYSVGKYLLWDVFIPALKETIVSLVINGVEMLFYGYNGTTNNKNKVNISTKPSYQQYYNNRQRETREIKYSRSLNDINDVLFVTRQDATSVLSSMRDLIDIYGQASVADFYDLAGEPSNYVDQNWGWYDVSNAVIRSIRNGQGVNIIFPRPESLK